MDPRRLLPALTAAACALVVAVLVVIVARPDATPRPRASSPAAPVSAAPTAPPDAAAVLRAWDERRSASWAAGDPGVLEGLYADGSGAGAADVRLLRDYGRRGLRVEGMVSQVLELRVASRSPDRLEVVVTDRIVGAQAVGAAAGVGAPVALPVGRPSTRRVVLVREGGTWLVSEVRGQDSAVASTSRTSSSSKS